MPQKFTIAPVANVDRFKLVGDKSKVTETMFWMTVENKVKELTSAHPEKYAETMATVKARLLEAKVSLTVLDVCFEIKGKP